MCDIASSGDSLFADRPPATGSGAGAEGLGCTPLRRASRVAALRAAIAADPDGFLAARFEIALERALHAALDAAPDEA